MVGADCGGPPPAPRHGGDVHAATRRWGWASGQILDFSANLNPLGPPGAALQALRNNLDAIRHYPPPLAPELRAALAERWGLPEANLAVGNGAAELIYLVARLAAGARALIPVPAFSEYARAVAAAGGTPQPWPLGRAGGFLPDPDRLAHDLAGAGLLFLCNPHNPSGAHLAPEAVLALAERTRAWVVVDEAFVEFTPAGEAASVIRTVPERHNLVVLRSLTKFYALPGLRVGAVAAPAELIRRWDASRDVWSVGALAQAAALAALGDGDHERQTRAWIAAERDNLTRALAALPGVTVLPSAANFLLCRSSVPAWCLQEQLGPRGILIRDCRGYDGLDEYDFRVAVRRGAENERLVGALQAVLA